AAGGRGGGGAGGGRRVGRRAAVGEVEGERAEGPGRDGKRERQPGGALGANTGGPDHAGDEREQDQRVVEVAVEEVVHSQALAEERVGGEDRQADDGHGLPAEGKAAQATGGRRERS